MLRHCPADGDVVHGVWDGFGGVDPPRPLLAGNGRAYALFGGPRAAVVDWPGLETYDVSVTDDLTRDGDRVNGPGRP